MENHLDFFKKQKKNASSKTDGVLLSAITNLKKDRVKKSNLKKKNISKTKVPDLIESNVSSEYSIPDLETMPPILGSDFKDKKKEVRENRRVDQAQVTRIVNGIVNNKFNSVKNNFVTKQPQNIIYNIVKPPVQKIQTSEVSSQLQQTFNFLPDNHAKTVKTENKKVTNFILDKTSVLNFIDNSFIEPMKTTLVKTINNFKTLPGMELGGIVNTPQTVVVAEKGPEAVIPLEKYNELRDKQSMFEDLLNKQQRSNPSNPRMEMDMRSNPSNPRMEMDMRSKPVIQNKADIITESSQRDLVKEVNKIQVSLKETQAKATIQMMKKNQLDDEIKTTITRPTPGPTPLLSNTPQQGSLAEGTNNPVPYPTLATPTKDQENQKQIIKDESRDRIDPVTRLVTKSFDPPKWRSGLY
jgi:hypothetical protein